MSKRCHECGRDWGRKGSPGFRESCAGCDEPLHCCANCRFYDAQARPWCREPQARDDRPRDVAQGNTCDYFLFREEDAAAQDMGRQQQAREGLATLFGDTPQAAEPKETPDWMKMDPETKPSLEDLFGTDTTLEE